MRKQTQERAIALGALQCDAGWSAEADARQAGLRLDGGHGPVGHDPATLDQDDTTRERIGLIEVVRREEDRAAVLDVGPDRDPHRLARGDVEAGRRLVQHDEPRCPGECERDGYAPLFATREPAELPLYEAAEVEALMDDRRVERLRVVRTDEVDHLADSERRREHRLLRSHAHQAAWRGHSRIGAEQTRTTLVSATQAEKHGQSRRLARAVRTEERDQLAFVDGEADVVERSHRPEPLRDAFQKSGGQRLALRRLGGRSTDAPTRAL